MNTFKVQITNPGSHFCNPLLKLNGGEFASREAACEAIYDALYDVIDGESGCEMVARSDHGEAYAAAYRDFIRTNGYATEDGVTATVMAA